MDPVTITFFALAMLIVVSALLVVGSRNIFHSAIYLIIALFGVAGLFVMLEAPFLAAAQVLIYVGAVAILMIFAVMLTSRIADVKIRHTNEQVPTGLAVSVGLLIVILYSLWQTPFKTSTMLPGPGAGKKLGELFLTKYVLPFEVVSVLLLAALIGAVIIAKRDKGGVDEV
ncbi:MAG TPA: NADH-quinone oxidoreductase subunit J [candidate division Zixibacteria bacterium]|nr:NADH-quinone oxidoreductase subunit J [candidate division Zixibacteria bacterium]